MSASASDIARLRRMTNEPTETTYDDEVMAGYIESWPVVDSEGRSDDESDWVAIYDLHAAAAQIWEEKAALVQEKHDFSADGASYSSDQMYQNAMDQARYHAARSRVKGRKVAKRPKETLSSLRSNLYLGIYANIDIPPDDDGVL